METPASPRVAECETEGPNGEIPPELRAQLNLDDDDDDDSDAMEIDENNIESAKRLLEINNANEDKEIDIGIEHSDSLPNTPNSLLKNPLSSSIPKDRNYIPSMVDFSDPIRATSQLINPFGNNKLLTSSDPIPISVEGIGKMRRLSDLQEQKLSDYIDDQLLTLQRGFVKYLSSKEDSNVSEGFDFDTLTMKLDEIIEFIWYTISQVSGCIPIVYHANVLLDESVKTIFENNAQQENIVLAQIKGKIKTSSVIILKESNNSNQELNLKLPSNISDSVYVSYIIKIIGDLIDYIVKYDLNTFGDWILLLRICGKLDNILSILIDYSIKQNKCIVNTTEKVRLSSIIQRTKIAVVSLFDNFVRGLGLPEIEKNRRSIEHLQTRVGEIYEGLVDRTSL